MRFEEIKKVVLGLSVEDRLRLMQEVGPEMCKAMMDNPEAMARMMPPCRETMGTHSEKRARMREMMSSMCAPQGEAARGTSDGAKDKVR